MPRKVKLFALSTCGFCKKAKQFLENAQIAYECADVDLLSGEEKERAREEVAKLNPRKSYPTLLVDDSEVVVGYDEEKLRQVLGL